MKTYIYLLHGQFGSMSSGGIDQIAAQITAWNIPQLEVSVSDWSSWQSLVDIINRHADETAVRMGCGYSLGANALLWMLGGVTSNGITAPGIKDVTFDYAAFLDPTIWSALTPLRPDRLKKGVHFKNYSLDVIGHGSIPAPGVNLDVVPTYESHLSVDFDHSIQERVLSDMRALIK